MIWQLNFSLKNHHTFGLECIAKAYFETANLEELKQVVAETENLFILGEGSNILLPPIFEKKVVRYTNEKVQIVDQNEDFVWVEVGAGKNWHQWVLWTLENNLSGVENLALIPGTVGAAPIQNIGAYGVEVKQVIEQVQCLDLDSMKVELISNRDCQFGYRNSIFKTKWKGKKFITKVRFKLSKKIQNQLNYGQLSQKVIEIFGEKENYHPKEVAETVIQIREAKLPNPTKIGNAGSFFKNPEVSGQNYQNLLQICGDMPAYKTAFGYKIPAAWLIEKVGMKAVEYSGAATFHKQPLVMINKGKATYQSVISLKEKIQKLVEQKFGIDLEVEVNIY